MDSRLGTNFTLGGNGDESGGSAGVVDGLDYELWVEHFGESELAGSASVGATNHNAAIPEPTGFLLAQILVFSGILLPIRRRG